MDVTIVLLVKNAEKYLVETLDAIFSQQTEFKLEVLVIDSGSKDRSLEILAGYPVRLMEIQPASFNHGETRNLGAQAADPQARYVVYLSQDAMPQNPTWLQSLLLPMEMDPQVAGVFSRHMPRPSSSPAMVRQLTTMWQSGGMEPLVKQMPASPEEYERHKFYYIYFSNTSSAIRKQIWDQIPLQRTSFAEDAIWADAVLRAGYRIVYEPASVVVHSHDYNWLEQFRQNVDHTNAMIRLFKPNPYAVPGFWRRLFGGLPRNIWRDWRFTLVSPYFCHQSGWQKLKWFWHSPGWHLASAIGAWVGAHLEHFPASIRLLVSRQERIRQLT